MEVLSYVAFAAIYVLFLVFFLVLTGPLLIVGAGFSLADWRENSFGQKALGTTLFRESAWRCWLSTARLCSIMCAVAIMAGWHPLPISTIFCSRPNAHLAKAEKGHRPPLAEGFHDRW